MAGKSKRVPVSSLKGVRLYNYLLSRLSKQNKASGSRQILSATELRAIVSQKLYPRFKGKKVSATEVTKAIGSAVRALPPKEICHPLYLSPAYLAAVEYYDIDSRVRELLPDCVDVRVNAGSIGSTDIFNTRGYSYTKPYGKMSVNGVVEAIRAELQSGESGFAYFSGIVKVKPGMQNDGQAGSYFIDFVLYIKDTPEVDDEPARFGLNKGQQKKKNRIRDIMAERFEKLQREKRKEKAKRKKASPEEKQKKIQASINADRALLRSKLITKKEFERRKAQILKRFEAKKKKP